MASASAAAAAAASAAAATGESRKRQRTESNPKPKRDVGKGSPQSKDAIRQRFYRTHAHLKTRLESIKHDGYNSFWACVYPTGTYVGQQFGGEEEMSSLTLGTLIDEMLSAEKVDLENVRKIKMSTLLKCAMAHVRTSDTEIRARHMNKPVRRQISDSTTTKRRSVKTVDATKDRVTPAQARANALAQYSTSATSGSDPDTDEEDEDSYIESVSDSED